MTRVPGLSISASVANLSLSAQRAIGVLPSRMIGVENMPFFWRSRVIETPPIATSKLPASKSAISFGHAVGTYSTLTPSALPSASAMSTSKPRKVEVVLSRAVNGA